MTDTGQVPGEGLPENAGMVEQPGIPAPGAYTFLDPSGGASEDDEILLMPGAQGAWSEHQPGVVPAPPIAVPAPQMGDPLTDPLPDPLTDPLPPAPQHAYETAGMMGAHEGVVGGHEGVMGAHEAAGRDSGALDLGAVRTPQAAASAAPTPPPARRPLHMGPPAPDSTGGVVRSLSDRGPAAAPQAAPAPMRTQGPPTTGPEYLDVPRDDAAALPGPRLGEVPQGAVPWPAAAPEAAAPQEQQAPVEAQVPAQAPEPVAEPAAVAEPVAAAEPEAVAEPVGAAAPAPAETVVPPQGGEPVPAAQFVPVEGQVPTTPHLAPTQAEPVAPEQPAAEAVAEPAAEPVAEPQPVAVAEPEQPVEPAPAPEPEAAVAAEEQAPVAEAVAEAAVPAEPLAEQTEQGPEQQAQQVVDQAEQIEQSAEQVEQSAEQVEQVAEPVTAPVETPEIIEAAEAPEQAAPEQPVEPAEPVGTAPEAEAVAETPAPVAEDTAPVAPAESAAPVAAGGAAQAEPAEEPQEPAQQDAPAASAPAPGYDEAEREAVLRVMRERRDIRNGFRSDPIPHEVLLRVLEAAHTAPSVGHSQPWDFVVIRSAETRRTMHELATRQREAYAKSLPKGRAKQFKELKIEAILDTPVNIVVTADPTRGGRHTLGRHTQPQMAPYSSALAVENLWLAARAEGLGVGWVSFFDEREMVRALGLPEHLEVVAYLCVGYVDEFPEEPELMQAGWSKRRPLSWVVHEETYGRRALPGEEPHDLLQETVANIRPLDAKALGEAWERQKRMTKPAGALGMLEIISAQLSGLSRMCPPPIPEPAAVAIFAGDHGVHAQGVTAWPQEVTGQMVANFLGGGAVCNAFANQVGAEVCVVDVGVASDLPATPGLLPRKVRPGTGDFTTGLAMTREEVVAAIEVGIETARDLVAAGNRALLTGEMGIANTTASAALISVYTGVDAAEVTGRGTGINDEMHARKVDVVRRALDLHQPDPADPIGVLAAVGGLEHAALVGLILGGASLRTPVILDGVSTGAAALVARAIAPEALAACIAGHRSAEPGHVAALNKLGLRPLVDLDLRLGEGTGALLALPVVQSAARAMHEVATFDSAGVTEK
ncbi:nicotinate-nucleotide--dimethylbenzimidazole phosphoribosyltransferase [Streptomyces tritici]|uniref:nicotinate-nucleotide--dimethylbenzimidazole phosphoribosyltransferase n=1 Tax=Streptomyces tritici TaxID=2054410 RepID=UPI003AEFD367